jgi:hypothetical protein
MTKKYRYNVALIAEDEICGTIDLAMWEAALVEYVTNSKNWKNIQGGGYCGYFHIDVDHPMEIED